MPLLLCCSPASHIDTCAAIINDFVDLVNEKMEELAQPQDPAAAPPVDKGTDAAILAGRFQLAPQPSLSAYGLTGSYDSRHEAAQLTELTFHLLSSSTR